MKTLLAFSGGIETTYVAWKLLKETNDELSCVFLHLDDKTGTRQFDADIRHFNKVKPVIEELKKIRNFNAFIKTCDRSEINDETNHYYTFFINFAAPYLNSGVYDRISTGRTWEQIGQKILADPNLNGSPSEIAGQRLFKRLVRKGELWNPLANHHWHQNFTKGHALKELPPELLEKTFSCVLPLVDENNVPHACGVCFKCLWIKFLKEKLASGMSPDEIENWRVQKCYEYGGGNVMAPLRYWIYPELGIKVPGHINQPKFTNKQEVIDYVASNRHWSTQNRVNVGIWEGL